MQDISEDRRRNPMPPGNGTRSMLLGLVGGYMLYLAYQVLRDTMNGTSSMSVAATVLSVTFLSVSGIGIMAYALHLWKRQKKEQQAVEIIEEAEDTQ